MAKQPTIKPLGCGMIDKGDLEAVRASDSSAEEQPDMRDELALLTELLMGIAAGWAQIRWVDGGYELEIVLGRWMQRSTVKTLVDAARIVREVRRT